MKKYITYIVSLFLLSCSLSQEESLSKKPQIDTLLIHNLTNEIEKAYHDSSISLLDTFLNDWHRIKPKEISELKSTLEKDIYEIFTQIFRPEQLGLVSNGEFSDQFYYKPEYYIVQNTIKYHIEEKPNEEYDWDSIPTLWDFRPNVSITKGKKVLYLTAEYDTVLNRFLDYEDIPLGQNNLMEPSMPIKETERKFSFLSSRLKILYGHWGNYWHLETHPEVSLINFTKDRKKAFVGYRIQYTFWCAEYIKDNGRWTRLKIESTGIE